MTTKDYIFIGILFYIGWFGSVFLARTDFSAASLIFPILLLVYYYFKNILALKDLVFALGISVTGIAFDFLLINFGLISTSGAPVLLIPVWLIAIWFLFSLSMVKLGPRFQLPFWVAAVLGGVMGPLSYKSGEFFEVLSFTNTQTFFVYTIFWALIFPVILNLSKRLV